MTRRLVVVIIVVILATWLLAACSQPSCMDGRDPWNGQCLENE
jgi:hypothetical protein